MFTIGYDISILEDERFTGVEKLALYLFSHLWQIAVNDKHILFCRSKPTKITDLPQNVHIVCVKNSKFWRYTQLPKCIRRELCDIFISPVAALPGFCRIPMLAYIHECPWLHDVNEKNQQKYRYAFWIAAIRAKVLLTNSFFTQKDVYRELCFRPKTEVIPPAADPFINVQPVSLEKVLTSQKITTKKYCLFVSTIRPKKNISLLMEAFRGLPNLHLICVGKIVDKTLICNKPNNVSFTGYLPNDQLYTLYQNAQAFLYISRNEGFGLPILEAFSHNCPVIASRCGSIPEVAGDAASYIDNWSVEELQRVINLVIDNNHLQSEMREKGKQQLQIYQWQNSAYKLYSVIKNIVKKEKTWN